MNWTNYGKIKNGGKIIKHGWDIDHKKPYSLFDMTNHKEQIKCFNWRNLQPMWNTDNCSKNSKYKFDIIHEIKLYFIT